MRVVAYFDGGCLNRVRAAGAAIVYDLESKELARRAHYIEGEGATVSVAEYSGLLTALTLAHELEATHVKVYGDSELIIRHFNGAYKCRKAHLQPWLAQVRREARGFIECVVKELPKSGKHNKRRHMNGEADALATECMKTGHDLPLQE